VPRKACHSNFFFLIAAVILLVSFSGCVDEGADEIYLINKDLNSLDDVNLFETADGQVLQFDEATGTWVSVDANLVGGGGDRNYTGISPIVIDNVAGTIASDYNHKDYNIGFLQVQDNARFLGDMNVGSGEDQVSIGKDTNKISFPQGFASVDWNGTALVFKTVDTR